jgi:hypothetical protein
MNVVIENAALVADVTNPRTHAESSIERFPASTNLFTGRNFRVILRYVKSELSREPSNIVDWVRDARSALRHPFTTKRTLGRDGNTVLVISHL